MALNFKQVSKAAGLVDSDIKSNHKAGQIADVFGETLTVNRVDITHGVNPVTGERTRYAIFTCDEYPELYFGGGSMFDDNVNAWRLAAGDADRENLNLIDDCDAVNAELKNVGGIKLKFTRAISKKGQPYNLVTFME